MYHQGRHTNLTTGTPFDPPALLQLIANATLSRGPQELHGHNRQGTAAHQLDLARMGSALWRAGRRRAQPSWAAYEYQDKTSCSTSIIESCRDTSQQRRRPASLLLCLLEPRPSAHSAPNYLHASCSNRETNHVTNLLEPSQTGTAQALPRSKLRP